MRLRWRSIGIGLVVATVALVLRASVAPLEADASLLLLLSLAVMIAAAIAGAPAAVACTLAATAGAALALLTRGPAAPDTPVALVMFVATGLGWAAVAGRLRVKLERARAQAAQVEAHARDVERADAARRQLIESVTDGVIAVDAAERITYVNPQARDVIGRGEAELLHRHLWATFPQIRGTELERVYRIVLETGEPQECEYDNPVTGRCTHVRIFPAQGGGATALFQDVTARKALLERMRDTTSTLTAIVDGTEDYIYAKDADGRYTLANRALLRLLGRTREDVLGRTDAELAADPAAVAAVIASDRQVMRERRSALVEESIATPAGMRVYLVNKAPRFDESSNVIGVISVATDITERKRNEVALADAHHSLEREIAERTSELVALSHHLLRAAEDEKANLAAELHDAIGGSLTTLTLMLGRLRTRLSALRPDLAHDAAQAENVVREIVAMTRRITSDLRPVTLDTLGLVPAVQDHVAKWSRKTGVDVSLETPPHLPPVGADVGLAVFRIVQESLTNVAKHAYATRVLVTLAMRHGLLCAEIEDDGVGLAQHALEHPQSHGLIGMRERAAVLGGTLLVEPSPSGRGTRVSLVVPLPRNLGRAEDLAGSDAEPARPSRE